MLSPAHIAIKFLVRLVAFSLFFIARPSFAFTLSACLPVAVIAVTNANFVSAVIAVLHLGFLVHDLLRLIPMPDRGGYFVSG